MERKDWKNRLQGIAIGILVIGVGVACGSGSDDSGTDTGGGGAELTEAQVKALIATEVQPYVDRIAALEQRVDVLSKSVKVVTTQSTATASGHAKTLAASQPIGCSFGGYDVTPQRLADSVECQADVGTLYTAKVNGGPTGDLLFLYYPTLDCTGEAYVLSDHVGKLALRHGLIVRNGSDVYWLPSNSTPAATTTNSYRTENGTCNTGNFNFNQVAVQLNDPALSGVENSYDAIETMPSQ